VAGRLHRLDTRKRWQIKRGASIVAAEGLPGPPTFGFRCWLGGSDVLHPPSLPRCGTWLSRSHDLSTPSAVHPCIIGFIVAQPIRGRPSRAGPLQTGSKIFSRFSYWRDSRTFLEHRITRRVKPTMACIGVRSSCDMLARNSHIPSHFVVTSVSCTMPLDISRRQMQIMVYFSQEPYMPKTRAEAEQWGQERKNDTHASKTDSTAWLYRRSNHAEARLSYLGHLLIENRHELIADAMATRADGEVER